MRETAFQSPTRSFFFLFSYRVENKLAWGRAARFEPARPRRETRVGDTREMLISICRASRADTRLARLAMARASSRLFVTLVVFRAKKR